jgi:hypothetical protein
MPCYDPPYDLPQMQADVVKPYVDTLREIDQYCAEVLTPGGEAPGPVQLVLTTVRDMVHARFRVSEVVHAQEPEPEVIVEPGSRSVVKPEPQPVELHGPTEWDTPVAVLRREIVNHQTNILWHQGQIEQYNTAIAKLERKYRPHG